MSQSHRGVADAGIRGTKAPADSPERILDALDDADCRALLEETAAETLTAAELADACGLPLSTTYRKLELLTEAGLLEERTRLRQTGKHVNEYGRRVDDVTVSVDAEDGVRLHVSYTEDVDAPLRF